MSPSFRDAMRAAGLPPPEAIEPGVLHRFPGAHKAIGNTAAWCKLFEDGRGGVFGDWSSGMRSTWQATQDKPPAPAEAAAFARRVIEARAQADADRKGRQARAAETAKAIFIAAPDAPGNHCYLARKNIRPHGARLHEGALVVPVVVDGDLASLQFIAANGTKRFHKDGLIAGGSYLIGDTENARALCVAEGFATAATIHEATGHPVAVAFNAGNLKAVAQGLRERFPALQLIVCADDDAGTAGNPGLTNARAAARLVGGLLAIPSFGADRPAGATDFNDQGALSGLPAVATAIAEARPVDLEPEPGVWPQPLDLTKLGAIEPTAPRFVVPGYVPAGYATLLAGHGGAGKSGITLQLAAAIALGAPWCGIPTERRRVLYLSCEDRRDVLHWRLTRIARQIGCDFADLAGWLHLLDLVGTDTVLYRSGGLTAAFGALDDMLRRTGAEVLFVDGASDTFGGSEINRAEVKGFVSALLGLIPQTGAVLLVAHVDKVTARNGATSEGYSGSTAWHNAVRSRLYLRPETAAGDDDEARTGALILECQKSNLARAGASIRFAWDEGAHLFIGAPEAQMCGIERKARDEIERRAILLALRGCDKAGIVVPSATAGQRTGLNVLAQRPEYPGSLGHGRATKKRFWSHIEALRQMKLIEECEYRRTNRHLGARLTLTEQGLRQCVEC